MASKPGADPEEIKGLHEDISAAFCSLAEVYLTDLCEEDEAQDTCLALMDKALAYDPTNIEALQVCLVCFYFFSPFTALSRTGHAATNSNCSPGVA